MTSAPSRPFSRHLADLVEEAAVTCPDTPAVISGDVQLSYRDLHEASCAFGRALAAHGVGTGSTVGLLCTNRWEWLATALGACRLGARVAAFNTFAKAWDLGYMLEHSRAEVLVTIGRFRTRDYVDTLEELIPQIRRPTWAGERLADLRHVLTIGLESPPAGAVRLEDVVAGARESLPPAGTSALDDAFVLYTSGSSARPKAVPMQHLALIENGYEIGRRMGLRADDRVWVAVPLFWAYGAVNALPAALTHRACLVLQEAFDPGEALELIERHRCTVAYTLPNMTNALVRHPEFAAARTSSLRRGLTLGSAAEIRLAAERLGVTEISNIYGSTETYGNCCVTPSTWPLERKLGCQGPPLPRVSLRILDPVTGEEYAPGEEGEIAVRGYVTRGYLDAPAAQNDVFGTDGWYRSGDLGRLDDDGCLHFTARATEMIKTGGINVAPMEVEEFIGLHPAVLETAVVGVPDPVAGEAIVAFVVARPSAQVTASDIREHCRGMAAYKVPARVHVIPELPKTDTGKLARRELVEPGSGRTNLSAEGAIGVS